MIIIDAETSGLDPVKNSILSLGAVEYDTGDQFYMECHIREGTEIDPESLKINGFTVEQCMDLTRPSPETLYRTFLKWALISSPTHMLAGQQVGSFDAKILRFLHDYYNVGPWPFGHRTLDLHSVAYAKFGKSLSLDGILKELGMAPEEKPHNGLTGAMLETKALHLLLK